VRPDARNVSTRFKSLAARAANRERGER